MKRTVTLILAIVMIISMMASCSDESDTNDTNDSAADTNSVEDTSTKGDESESESEEETEEETEPEFELPVQTDVPCNFDEALDLSDDILVSDFMLEDGNGQWILGDDNTQMTNVITEDLLNEYSYFAFTYTTDYCDEFSTIALMFKFLHTDETKTEFLCNSWFAWGPADMTYQASSFATMNVYGDGVFYVPTEAFLTHESFAAGDVINQMGLCAVEESGTFVYLTITGAYLTK